MMKRIYEKPIIAVESLIAEEIMNAGDEMNLLSRHGGTGGYEAQSDKFITFNNGDPNVLNSIDYGDFAN